MKILRQEIPEVIVFEPKAFGDARGYFLETWQEQRYREAGIAERFVQDNLSRSSRGTLRGLHLQHPHAQGKLVSVIDGEVFDVAIDVRAGSPSFGKWVSAVLSSQTHRQMYVPPGFAHGFCVTSEYAVFTYKCTDIYAPADELGIAWNDPDLGIPWPCAKPLLSERDQRHPQLSQIPVGRLPQWRK